MTKIQNVSLFFKTLFQVILFALPVLHIVSWLYAPNELVLFAGFVKLNAIPANYSGMHLFTSQGVSEKAILHTLTAGEKILGFSVGTIPTLIHMYVLYVLIQLFNLYAKGDIFSMRHVKYIRNIGFALLISQLIEPFYQFAMGIILTINNPPHHRFASVTLDQMNVGILLTALLLILISWIVAEGCKLHEEQQLTV